MRPSVEDVHNALFGNKDRIIRAMIANAVPERYWGEVVQAAFGEALRLLYFYWREISLELWVFSILDGVIRSWAQPVMNAA